MTADEKKPREYAINWKGYNDQIIVRDLRDNVPRKE